MGKAPSVRDQLSGVGAMCAEVRSGRNRATRRRNAELADEREEERARSKRRRQLIREELELRRRWCRVRVPLHERPQISQKTAKKLYARGEALLGGTIGSTDAKGRDGLYSMFFGWTPRGLQGEGRGWRKGEAARFARYILRENALEEGELGWFSNIGDDRAEIVSFFRTLEEVERADRKNANVYISIIIPLPFQLKAKGRRRIARLITAAFERRGLPFVASLHLPDADGDQRNFHLHIQLSQRPFERHAPYDWSFSAAKETQFRHGPGISMLKRHTVRQINRVLKEAGIDRQYTHRTRADRGEVAGEMKRPRSKRKQRIDVLQTAKEKFQDIREGALCAHHHFQRASLLRNSLNGLRAKVAIESLRVTANVIEAHKARVLPAREGVAHLRRAFKLKEFSNAVATHIVTAKKSRTGLASARMSHLVRLQARVTAVKTKLNGARSGLSAMRTARDSMRHANEARTATNAREQARRRLVGAAAAVAAHRQNYVQLAGRADGWRAYEAHAASIAATRLRRQVLITHQQALNQTQVSLERYRLFDRGRLDPGRVDAARRSAEPFRKTEFLPLERAHGRFKVPSGHPMAPQMFADIHFLDPEIQGIYRDKWNAMLRALEKALVYEREDPFVRTPDRLLVKTGVLKPALAEAYDVARSDPEVQGVLRVAAEYRLKVDQERKARIEKRREDDQTRRENIRQVLATMGPKQGMTPTTDRLEIWRDVRVLAQALSGAEIAIKKDKDGFIFRGGSEVLKEVTDRLVISPLGRVALSRLADAVTGHQPYAAALPAAWQASIPSPPQAIGPSGPGLVGTTHKRGPEGR